MSLTVNTKTYTADRVQPDTVAFAGPAHTATLKDVFILGRKQAVPGRSSVARYYAKQQRSVVVNTVTLESALASINAEISIPVGASDTDVDALLADFASYLGSAAGKAAVKKLQINF